MDTKRQATIMRKVELTTFNCKLVLLQNVVHIYIVFLFTLFLLYQRPDGRLQTVNYKAGEFGYTAEVSYKGTI